MIKTRKLVSIVLAISVFTSMSTCASAQGFSTVDTNNSTNKPIISSQTVEYDNGAAKEAADVARSPVILYGTKTVTGII